MSKTLLDDYCTAHNHGVRTGDFSGLLALFATNATLTFHGIPVGPFHGRKAIAEAFASQPPDNELVLFGPRIDEAGRQTVRYRWKRSPADPGGTLLASIRENLIHHLEIFVDQEESR